MKKTVLIFIFLSIMLLVLINNARASDLYMPVNFQNAYEKKTRSLDGKPGQNYWQNRADYSIKISFDPETRKIKGSETITYFNNSPDSLNELLIHLFPNLYKKGNSRDFNIDFIDESDGVTIEEIRVNGIKIDISSNSKSVEYGHTNFKLSLPEFLLAGRKLSLTISWNYVLNKYSHQRTGAIDSSSFFVAYFFPRIAVYDDIDGWNDFKYTGTPEFYNDFGNFEVSITVPENFVVWATGTLENPEEVLTTKYLQQYRKAFTSDKIIHIVDSTEIYQNTITKQNDKNTWKFKATNVTDFAFATSDHYLWDATSLIVDKKNERRVFIDAAYNKESKDFYQVASIARQSVEYMSFQFPGLPYPFPKVTVFNGADGMEYPMMVNDISKEKREETIKLTSHEVLHGYLPFFVGCNETKYAWMDEGFTSFADYVIFNHFATPENARFYYLHGYQEQAGEFLDTPIFTNSEFLKRPTYSYNSYPKPASFFLILQDLFGEEKFKQIIHEFMNRWKGKHPMPYDLFFTIYDVSGENLDWLIKPWFYEFGYVDLAIKDVIETENEYEIQIQKKGRIHAPFQVKIIFEDDSEKIIKENVAVWKNGNTSYTINEPITQSLKSVELIDGSLLDADVSNNVIKHISLGCIKGDEKYKTITDDGAWCWFQDPRAVYVHGKYKRTYAQWITQDGKLQIGFYDFDTKKTEIFTLKEKWEVDDHNVGTFLVLPDFRLMVFYAQHNGTGLFCCTSTNPEDITQWENEVTVTATSRITYSHPVYLSDEKMFYVFWRGESWKPTLSKSADGKNWSEEQILIQDAGRDSIGIRPYTKIVSDGKSTIHFAFTDGHPNDEAHNSVHYVRYEKGFFYKADGTVAGSMDSLPIQHKQSDIVYDAKATNVRAWIWDIALDEKSSPVIAYTRFPENTNHRYCYARWTGQNWRDVEITPGGKWFPQTISSKEEREQNYSGGICLDHSNPSIVYLSREINGVFEIEKWISPDRGVTWKSTPITENSVRHNVRPVVPRVYGKENNKSLVLWMNGCYRFYTKYNTAIKIFIPKADQNP